jgi:predicted nucleotidyltransferase component of viral defense system
MKLNEIRDAYMSEGASYLDASSRTSQEVVMSLIAKSPFSKNVTIKGGVMMRHISEDDRRATQDLDLDFIKYSISNASVRKFIETLNRQSDEVAISITKPIEELKHQDYSGKRAFLLFAIESSPERFSFHKATKPIQKTQLAWREYGASGYKLVGIL